MKNTLRIVLFALAAVAVALPAAAQTASKKILTLDGARQVAAAAEAEAKRLNAGGAIAIVDDGGSLLLLVRLDNTFPAASAHSSVIVTEPRMIWVTFPPRRPILLLRRMM